MQTISIDVDDQPQAFEVDFEHRTWSASTEIAESEFPLIAEVAGKRYELYSDGTLSEVELH